MIICHPPHPSHLSQDQDWISRTFLEQVVLVVAAQILSLCLKWYLPSDTLLAGNQYLCDEWCQGKDVLLSIRYFTSEVGCPHIVESWTRMMEFLNKDCSIHYDIPFLGKFSQSVFVFLKKKSSNSLRMTKWKHVCFERTIIRSARRAETVGQKPVVKRFSGKKERLSTSNRLVGINNVLVCWNESVQFGADCVSQHVFLLLFTFRFPPFAWERRGFQNDTNYSGESCRREQGGSSCCSPCTWQHSQSL